MTIGDWLATRTPAPPEPLATRLADALAPVLGRDASEVPDAALGAAAELLEALLRDRTAGRDRALDLLAADALVTYAFEAASENPERIAARADAAMARLSVLAVEGSA